MKKVSIWTMSVAVLMLVSCSKSTDADQPDPEPNPVDERVPIQLGTGKILTADVLSRGIGSVGDTEVNGNDWNGETLYIYGITSDGVKIGNVEAIAPTTTTPALPPATVTGAITWAPPTVPFYYEGNLAYTFWGYHVDDAAGATPAPTKNAEGAYTLEFTIDGTQDLMVAKTDRASDIAAVIPANSDLVGKETSLYSAWSARRKVVPNLVFTHLLTRLNFKILAGSTETANLTEKVSISKIEVSSKSKGTLVVIPEGEGKTQRIEDMQDIPEPNPNPFLVKKEASNPTDSKVLEDLESVPAADATTATPVGVGLLVFPADSYKALIYTTQTINNEEKTAKIPWEIKLPTDGALFAAGTAYNIIIKVYGLEEIKIDATLTPWAQGEDVTIDPDDGNITRSKKEKTLTN